MISVFEYINVPASSYPPAPTGCLNYYFVDPSGADASSSQTTNDFVWVLVPRRRLRLHRVKYRNRKYSGGMLLPSML